MKGNASAVVLAVVVALTLLFVGMYMLDKINSLQAEKDLYDYVYTTVTNSTEIQVNNTNPGTHILTIGDIATIEGETAEKTLTAKIQNTDTSDISVDVYLNDNKLGTVTATAGTNTTATFENVNWIANSDNVINFTTTYTGTGLKILETSGKYPSDKALTNIGRINTDLITNTKTVFSIIILVITISALAIAIGVLRGTGGGTSATAV